MPRTRRRTARAHAALLVGLLALAPSSVAQTGGVDEAPPTAAWPEHGGATLADRLRARVEARVSDDEFSGTVLAAIGDEVVLRDVRGMRDLETGDPNRLDTRFNIGSITKTFTAVVVAQLMEEGALAEDTLVGEVLPDYPNRRVRETVRVRHLLTHSSGIPDYWRSWYRRGKPATDGLHGYRPFFERRSPEFEPGEHTKYSNSGVVVLGLMIEALTGKSYYDAVRERVFEPAGMTRTAWLPIREPVADQAIGYGQPRRGKRTSGADENPARGCSAGGCFSTVDDMHRFARALLAGELLPPERLELFTTTKVQLHPGVDYGYLFFTFPVGGVRHFGHDGGSTGVNAEWHVFPEQGAVLVVLSNYEGGADLVSGDLLGLLVEAGLAAAEGD